MNTHRFFSSARGRAGQRGAAALVVVALLFSILSLVTAYTHRSLLFEQRSAGNQLRSTQAFEAAEAGLEWALALLNAGRLDAACRPSTLPTDTSFRQRYLTIHPASGHIDPAGALTSAPEAGTAWPSCRFDGSDWSCHCPEPGAAPALAAAPADAGVLPAFRVRFARASATQPGVLRIEVNGCTRLDDACLDFPARAVGGEGRATVSALVALRTGVAAPPLAAVTARGDVSGTFTAVNTDPRAAGLAVLAGGAVAGVTVQTTPGTPAADGVREHDSGLAALPGGDRLFSHTFAIWPTVWRDQPGAVRPVCAATCTAAEIRATVAAHPGRMLWIDGDVDLDSGADIGSAVEPVILVAGGRLRVDIGVFGLLVSRAPASTLGGSGRVNGAVIAEGDLAASGSVAVVHDADLLEHLHHTTGSFVRVPGGWRDF
ncbi:MAG: pilus assembly PilX N-terminal domain-containing protein [Rubrivivax sp.]